MSEKLKGSLSAIIDGEADEFELRRVLDEIDKNEELRATWERYHLIGSRLRGEHIDNRAKLRQQVWDALEFEGGEGVSPASLQVHLDDGPQSRLSPRLGRWTGIAVAATVAVAVVVGLNIFDTPTEDPPSVVTVIEGPVGGELAQVSTPEDIQRHDAYMVSHAQLMGMNQQGFTPFVKLVVYGRQ